MARRPTATGKPEGDARPSPAKSKRKPEPESRGRKFFLEFLSVTLGVLLALILEQAATSWRERQRVADLRASMDEEIADFGDVLRLRQRVDPCINGKLNALEAWMRTGSPAGPVRDVTRPPFFFTSRGAWNSDASDQLSRYLGAPTFRIYGEIYQGMELFTSLSNEEQHAWVTLQTLEGDEDAISPDRRAHLREAIALARNSALLLKAIADGMLDNAGKVGVKPNDSLADRPVPICRPLTFGAAVASEPARAPPDPD